MAKKKKENQEDNKTPFYKKKGFWIALGVIVVLSMIFGGDDDKEPEESAKDTTEQVLEKDTTQKKDSSKEEVDSSEDVPEEEVVEETDKEDDNLEFLESGMAVYTDTSEVVFGEKSHLEIFSGNHVRTLKENYEQFKNGVIFRNVMSLQDQYGNQEDTNVIAVYYSPETIEKINFDNWPTLDASGLYETADNVFIHYVLLSKVPEFQQYTNSEDAPSEFINYMGSTVE